MVRHMAKVNQLFLQMGLAGLSLAASHVWVDSRNNLPLKVCPPITPRSDWEALSCRQLLPEVSRFLCEV
jgi:hypothetical protein